MAERIKLLIQKRTSLKSQITSLTNILEKDRQGRHDKIALKLRMARVTYLYHAYEEYNDELLTLDSNESHKDEFANVQERFYSLASRFETLTGSTEFPANAGTSSGVPSPVNTNPMHVVKRKIKLPEAYCITLMTLCIILV
ncbi:hypothetical protein ALC57_16852 [Trachymyrmex cornetzi]|uniref:Uncharacterized protein n=1 Tax=Trachymyrmex cornetzi TaxID=471704 RepID=A0A151IUA9_9HYME|nr:hypothetical protein ALC57_16852 [Trachymyrmex cornetzi]